MIQVSKLLLAGVAFVLLSGCVTVMDATSEKPIQPDPGKRSFGTYLDDQKLESVISVNLRKTGPGLEKAHINVFCFNGVVLLTGEVPSRELRELAGETARDIAQVRQVHNQLLIQNNATFFSRTNDNWLASKVRAKVLLADIESERIKVIVENRVVYLMGLVTEQEARKVAESAANTDGVNKVVRVFEYIDAR